MYKKVNLVMLPTKSKSIIWKLEDKIQPLFKIPVVLPHPEHGESQHVYITSDDEIKEGEWYLNTWGNSNDPIICEVNSKDESNDCNRLKDCCKKIIATTDSSLTPLFCKTATKSIPQIPQQFIEHFVSEYNKSNIITEIMVEYEVDNFGEHNLKLKVSSDNTITIRKVKDSWSKNDLRNEIKNNITCKNEIVFLNSFVENL